MTISISINAVRVGAGRRKAIAAKVKAIADSIVLLGLRTPITVLPADGEGQHALVAGRHRLEACRLLGHTEIAADIEADKLAAQLWEIAENFHRSDLTAARRAVLVGRWVKLTAAKIKEDQSVNVAQVGPDPRERGVRAAARALGIARSSAQRAVNIADHLSKAALREAERLGLLNNQRVLSDAASSIGADEQVACLQHAAERMRKRKGQRAQMKAALKGTDEYTKAAGKAKFHAWFDTQDITDQIQVRLWLQSGEADAYFEEWQQMYLRSKAKALH